MPLPKADQMSSWPDIVPLLTTRCLYWGCQGANRGVEVPYTMFQNPRSKPSCHKSTKTIITQKVLVTQSSNIVHCNWHTQKSISADFQAFLNTFSLFKLTFFNFFVRGSSTNSHNFHILLILTGKITQVNQTYVSTGLGLQMPLLGRVHLTEGQPDPKANQDASTGGYIWAQINWT